MKKIFSGVFLIFLFLSVPPVFAVDIAPRISDREIIESLAELKAGQQAINKRLDDLQASTNNRFDDMNKRFDDMNKRFDDSQASTNSRFDTLQWMLGLFITIALVILGAVVRMLWDQKATIVKIETSLETQQDEISFLKTLVEKLLPQRGVL